MKKSRILIVLILLSMTLLLSGCMLRWVRDLYPEDESTPEEELTIGGEVGTNGEYITDEVIEQPAVTTEEEQMTTQEASSDEQSAADSETTTEEEISTEEISTEQVTAQPDCDDLGHLFGDWQTILDPTCTEQGLQRRDCERCGHYEEQGMAAVGHTYMAEVTAPTCTQQGYTTYTCHCGNSYEDDYVEITSHDLGDWYTTLEATCTKDGMERRDCSGCEYYEENSVVATGHSYVFEVVVPTCTEQGYTINACVCGDQYVDAYVDATGHAFGIWQISVPATCTANGEEYRECDVCKEKETAVITASHKPDEFFFMDDYCGAQALGFTQCIDCGMILSEYDHRYQTTITRPTCTKEGQIVHACQNCGSSYSETLPAGGHILGDWSVSVPATCNQNGIQVRSCLTCDATVEIEPIDMIAHSYASTAQTGCIIYTCTVCYHTYLVQAMEYVTVSFICDGEKVLEDLQIEKGSGADIPVPTKEGYVFSGWYLDEGMSNAYLDTYSFGKDTVLYGTWSEESITEQISTNNVITQASPAFTFQVNSTVALTDANLAQHVFVTDVHDATPELYIVSAENGTYTIGSRAYEAGMTYRVTVGEGVFFVGIEGDELWFITKRENVFDIRYSSDTILIPESGINAGYESDGMSYILMRTDCLDVGDNAVVYRGEDQTDISMIFTVVMEGTYDGFYYYMIGEADYDEVFDKLDYYYSGDLSVEGMEFDANLREELTQQVLRSSLYARFNAAATALTGVTIGDYYYDLNNDPKPEISYNAEGSKVTFTIKIVAKFARMHVETREVDSIFDVTMEITTELGFDLVAQVDGVKSVSLVAEVDNATKVNLFASIEDEYDNKKELNYFKNFFEEAKKGGSFSEIDSSSASTQKELSIGKLPIAGVPGITLSINISNVFDFEAVGELGVSAQLNMSAKFGLQYAKNKGVSAIKSFEAEAKVTFYMMGKITVKDTLKFELSVNVIGILNGYISASVGPYVEVGGIASATFSTSGVHSVVAGGYVEIGVDVQAEIGASAKIQLLWNTVTLFDEKLTLFSQKFKIFSIGQKQVPLYFIKSREDITLEESCEFNLTLSELIDCSVFIQDLDEMEKKTEKPDCKYYLNGDYSDVTLTEDGVLTLTGNSKEQTIEIKVVYGNVYKIVKVTYEIAHEAVHVPAVDATCTEAGNTEYTYCTKCEKVLEGEKLQIEAQGHKYGNWNILQAPTCTEAGVEWQECHVCREAQARDVDATGHLDRNSDGVCESCGLEFYAPGLYDISGNRIVTWDELVNDFGMDVEKDYDPETVKSDASSPYYVLTQNAELSAGAMLVLGNVSSIGDYAFYECTGLLNLSISNHVIKIGSGAFAGCTGLERLMLTDSLTEIAEAAFANCMNVTDVYFIGSEQAFADIAIGAENGCFSFAEIHYNSPASEALAFAHTITWNPQDGCIIVVTRVSTLREGAPLGVLQSGDEVYYGDLLSITYKALTGYSVTKAGSDTITVTESVTPADIYAEVAPNTYSIVYNPNGGTGTMQASVHTYDKVSNLKTNAFVCHGRRFLGWSTDPAAAFPEYANGHVILNLSAEADGKVTLYAVWELITSNNYTLNETLIVNNTIDGAKGKYINLTDTFDLDKLKADGYTMHVTVTYDLQDVNVGSDGKYKYAFRMFNGTSDLDWKIYDAGTSEIRTGIKNKAHNDVVCIKASDLKKTQVGYQFSEETYTLFGVKTNEYKVMNLVMTIYFTK